MKFPYFLLAVFSILALPPRLAADYGVIIREQADLRSKTDPGSAATLAPWFSLPLGERTDLYLSAGASLRWREGRFSPVPELFRLEFSFRPLSSLAIRLGRIDYQDPSLSDKLHLQYVLVRYLCYFPGGFNVSAAGAASLALPGTGTPAFAASLEGGWMPPGALADRLSLGFRWASGAGPSTMAYTPLIGEAQGTVIRAGFSGLVVLSAAYEARFFSSLSAAFAGRYFFRTDSVTFSDPYVEGDSRHLGLEVSLSLLWAPVSDLSFSLEGGILVPRTGKAFRDDAPLYRQLALGIIVSL
jgi:hypothetical protein